MDLRRPGSVVFEHDQMTAWVPLQWTLPREEVEEDRRISASPRPLHCPHLDFQQGDLSITAGLQYEIQFMARSTNPLTFLQMSMQGGTAPYPYYGLNGSDGERGSGVDVYSVYFTAPVTASVEFPSSLVG